MASETALLASRFAVSIAQTRALVASWLGPDSSDNEGSRNNGTSGTYGSDRAFHGDAYQAGRQQEQSGKTDGTREISRDKLRQNGEQAYLSGNEDVPLSTEEEETSTNDEDVEFSKKYTVIVGRGGIGASLPANTTESSTGPPVSAFRQRKTIEFMQKQILKRRVEEARIKADGKSPDQDEIEDGDEEDGRTTVAYRNMTKPGSMRSVTSEQAQEETHSVEENGTNPSADASSAKKRRTLSVLDDLIQKKQEQMQRKRKKTKKKKKKSGESEAGP
ncbi:hypothetical protein V1517DRAFT_320680 [Lipomyces orientalis]|uniref:Uncharacterized protein n=1 Tax=Lipomyces orientalis TaxID=1233043 RepID=A0ACC3TQH4_9ASCO